MSEFPPVPSIWSIKRHDTLSFETAQGIVDVLRVTPGWVYTCVAPISPCWCRIAVLSQGVMVYYMRTYHHGRPYGTITARQRPHDRGVRRAIQQSQESIAKLAKRYDLIPKPWRNGRSGRKCTMRPWARSNHAPRS